MLSLDFLFWSLLIGALLAFWWRSDKIKHFALQLVARHCRQQGLQLLDQTMVLKGLKPERNQAGNLVLRRRYDFEFTSTGTERYAGTVVLLGQTLHSLELAPHILPEDEQQHLH